MTKTRAALILLCACARALPANAADDLSLADVWTDAKLYVTAPIRWDAEDWLYFGGVLAAVGTAHAFDGDVRDHFAGSKPVLDGKDPNSVRDFIPTGVAILGTWACAGLADEPSGRTEAYTMLEAAAFSSITATGVKYAAGRARPNETLDTDDWRAGGSSFPSLHSTVSFAVGTVLAESGSDDYRWLRRLLGYGLAAGTTYVRLKENEHWLSDTVAGAAIGMSTGIFAVNRHANRHRSWDVTVQPAQGGGVAVAVNVNLQ